MSRDMDKDQFDLSKYDLTSFLVKSPPATANLNAFYCPPQQQQQSSNIAQNTYFYPSQSQFNNQNQFYPEEYSQNDNVTYSSTLSSTKRSNTQSTKSAGEIRQQNIVNHQCHNYNNQFDAGPPPPFRPRPQSISTQYLCQPPLNNLSYRQFNFANVGEPPVQLIRRRRISAENELLFNNQDSIDHPLKRHKMKKSPVKFITSKEGEVEEQEINDSNSVQEQVDQMIHIENYGVGSIMLLKMGFRPGEGLGKNRQGIKVPIEQKVKNDRKPIG